MAVGAALAMEIPMFRQTTDGYEINGHISKVIRSTVQPSHDDDHQQMIDELKYLFISSWSTGKHITDDMIKDEYKIPFSARPFQSLVSSRTKSFGCSMVRCTNMVNGEMEYVRIYVCMFNGRMIVKDKYDTVRPLYKYKGLDTYGMGMDKIDDDPILMYDSKLLSFMEGRHARIIGKL